MTCSSLNFLEILLLLIAFPGFKKKKISAIFFGPNSDGAVHTCPQSLENSIHNPFGGKEQRLECAQEKGSYLENPKRKHKICGPETTARYHWDGDGTPQSHQEQGFVSGKQFLSLSSLMASQLSSGLLLFLPPLLGSLCVVSIYPLPQISPCTRAIMATTISVLLGFSIEPLSPGNFPWRFSLNSQGRNLTGLAHF